MIVTDIDIVGLTDFEKLLKKVPDETRKAASMAINTTAKRARTAGAKEIRNQVNLRAKYVNDNLTVTRSASRNDLRAVINGRARPVMLHRYVTGWASRSKGRRRGARVSVKRGGASRSLSRTFEMKLNSGNMAIVMRTDGGEPDAAYKPRRLFAGRDDLWVLYSPSVDQLFKTVKDDIAPDMSKFVAKEFKRHIARFVK